MNYGGVLKQIRRSKGLTLHQVADRLGRRANWLCRIENNQRRLTVDTLVQLCRIYGVEPAYVLQQESERGKAG